MFSDQRCAGMLFTSRGSFIMQRPGCRGERRNALLVVPVRGVEEAAALRIDEPAHAGCVFGLHPE